MRVLQLIDSLEGGGAERMAINTANALVPEIEKSYLCVTRKEGILKGYLHPDVNYYFLKKSKTLDVRAIKHFLRFIKNENIQIVHAHATSFFLATMVKLWYPKLILVWHDHYGKSEFLEQRPKLILKCCSIGFNHICAVNKKLENWSKNTLYTKSVSYISNYAVVGHSNPVTTLKGIANKRIVCLANLRVQKDHLSLLKAFKIVLEYHADWTLHMVGKDFQDAYALTVKQFIKEEGLKDQVFVYGSCPDSHHVLCQSDIGVLSSKSEGLPLALLEYGLAKLPVVVTDVGDCSLVISDAREGQLVPPNNVEALSEGLLTYIQNEDLRKTTGLALQQKVLNTFSETSTIASLIEIYKRYYK